MIPTQRAEEELASTEKAFWAELWDAVAPRTVALVLGVLAIQLLFIASYAAAFHEPTPHGVPISVVTPAALTTRVVGELNALPGGPVRATALPSRKTATAAVRSDNIAGALIVDPASKTDTVLVASGAGAALASAVEQIATATDASQHRTVQVDDLVPLQPGDYRGLTGFTWWLAGSAAAISSLRF
jgi:hypothetical protein